jgi:hypothetical protein
VKSVKVNEKADRLIGIYEILLKINMIIRRGWINLNYVVQNGKNYAVIFSSSFSLISQLQYKPF